MVKKKVGVFKFTCCSGCQVEILNQAERFLELRKKLDFKYMKILKKGKIQKFDIGFIEGAISSKEEIELAKEIREKTDYLIALGSCAVLGGISAMQNFVSAKNKRKTNYTPKDKSVPVEKYVKVDYRLRGCPITGSEFLQVINDLLAGKTLRDLETPVCNECRKNNNECLIEKGEFCAGPITYAGCKAICPENNTSCIGCRGITKDANLKEWKKKMKEKGFEEKSKEVLRIFNHEP